MANGMNTHDTEILRYVYAELEAAEAAGLTQRRSMEHLLFAKHLLETLLRQMQDN